MNQLRFDSLHESDAGRVGGQPYYLPAGTESCGDRDDSTIDFSKYYHFIYAGFTRAFATRVSCSAEWPRPVRHAGGDAERPQPKRKWKRC